MPRPIVNDPRRRPREGSPEFSRVFVLVFVIAALIGVGGGLILIAWNLIRVYLWH